MDVATGKLYTEEESTKIKDKKKLKFFNSDNFTLEQLERKKVGRNEVCPCGSGKKFKKCCLDIS